MGLWTRRAPFVGLQDRAHARLDGMMLI
jgi:hypothetical protein